MDHGRELFTDQPLGREEIVQSYGPDFAGQLMIEELLVNYDGRRGIPWDFKFFCFGRRIAACHVIERGGTAERHVSRCWYVTDKWRRFPFSLDRSVTPLPVLPPRPACFDDMVRIVRDVGGELGMFMRIDMYATPKGPVFGEFTAWPRGGSFFTPEANEYLGRMWRGEEGAARPSFW